MCATACGTAGDREVSRAVIDTIGGIIRVTTIGDGIWRSASAWRVDSPGVRIGGLEADGPRAFGEIAGLAVGPDRRIFVADGQAREVRVFSADGRFLLRFGRNGEGPGEFSIIDAVAVLPDGRIAVRDPRLHRLSLFDARGSFMSQFRLERPFTQVSGGTGLWATSDARILDRVITTPTGRIADPSAISIIRYASDGTGVDTLRLVEIPPGSGVQITRDGTLQAMLGVPFAPGPIVAVDGAGNVAYGTGAVYELDVIPADNKKPWRFARTREPDAITEEEREAARAALEEAAARMVPGGQVAPFDIPPRKPAYTHLIGDISGHWWAGRRRGATFEEQPTSYDIFAPDGRLLGAVTVPPMRILQIGEDFIAGVARDELDVELVVILPLIRPGA